MAEQVFRELTGTCSRGYEVRSAGTVADQSGHQLTEADLSWADLVCVMESAHHAYITDRWGDSAAKVRVLGIPDIYVPGDPVLQDLLRTHILLILAEHAQ